MSLDYKLTSAPNKRADRYAAKVWPFFVDAQDNGEDWWNWWIALAGQCPVAGDHAIDCHTQTEICDRCGAFRTHGHDAALLRVSAWRPASEYDEARSRMNAWRPASEYDEAIAETELD